MELKGLKRALEYIDGCDLSVSEVVTDRHIQVKKYMAEKQTEKEHFFDVWHLAKGENFFLITFLVKEMSG